MGHYIDQHWQGRLDAPGRKNQRSGAFRAYIPDQLTNFPLRVDTETAQRAAALERRILAEQESKSMIGIDALARLLIRREAVASSRIEGLEIAAKRLAIAQLEASVSQTHERPGRQSTEAEVVANIRIVDRAADHLARKNIIETADILELQSGLVAETSLRGLRTSQNWVGGNNYHPLDAEYVPPPPDQVPHLVADLANYLTGATHGALIQAALVHAQFESIHPFPDGNGRVGRALIHTALRRRLGHNTILLPISAALATRSNTYVTGLTSYRCDAAPSSNLWHEAVGRWITVFLDAAEAAINLSQRFRRQLEELSNDWATLHEAANSERQRALRSDATSVLVRQLLPQFPIFSVTDLEATLGKSNAAIRKACDELSAIGIIEPLTLGRNRRGWWAPEIFQIFDSIEQSLSATNWGMTTN